MARFTIASDERRAIKAKAKINLLKFYPGTIIIAIVAVVLDNLLSAVLDLTGAISNIGDQYADFLKNLDYTVFTPATAYTVGGVTLISALILAPFRFSSLSYYTQISRGRIARLRECFKGYLSPSYWKKCLILTVEIWLLALLWLVVFVGLPVGVIAGAIYFTNGISDFLTGILALTAVAVAIAGAIAWTVKIGTYVPAEYFLSWDPDVEMKGLIKKSTSLMHGHEIEFFVFNLTFIGWKLIQQTMIGGIMFATGYIEISTAGYVDNLIFLRTGAQQPVRMPAWAPEDELKDDQKDE